MCVYKQIVGVLSLLIVAYICDAATINFVYVHGVQSCVGDKQTAHNALIDLKTSIQAALTGTTTHTYSHTHVNLYTEPASPCVPTNSKGPLYMDDWEIGQGCGSSVSGHPGTTAYEWRYRLSNAIKSRFGNNGNVILVGHSCGARVSVEVAANVGVNGVVNSQDWGVQSKILGVVTINGMINDLNNAKYNFLGPTNFLFGCKDADILMSISGNCPNGNGWCEYATASSGAAANDWLAANKFILNLASYGSCSPSIWKGLSDGALPFDAQSSPAAPGLDLTINSGSTYESTSGIYYGPYCHSAITTASIANHAAAVSTATTQIKTWLLTTAQRVVRYGSTSVPPTSFGASSAVYNVPSGCAANFTDGKLAVAGVCRHPGLFDGDDHGIPATGLTVADNSNCGGSFKWSQNVDSGKSQSATIFFKSHAQLVGGVATKALP